MKKLFYLRVIKSLVLTSIIFYFLGFKIEKGIRNFYRKNICHCDTLRPLYIVNQEGIPTINYHSTSGEYIGLQSNPVEVCQYALKYLENEDTNAFFNCANWLINNYEKKVFLNHYGRLDTMYLYKYNYPWLPYQVKNGWCSAMTQGMALSVLSKAFTITNDCVYTKVSNKILSSFLVSVDSGGVTYKYEKGWWYEEYADSEGKKPHVLNGMMHALLGLYDHHTVLKDTLSLFLFNRGISLLQEYLPKYDREIGSYYDIHHYPASWTYHNIHVEQLKRLYNYTKNESIRTYYNKWKKHKEPNYLIQRIKDCNSSFIASFTFVFLILMGIQYKHSRK